MQKKQLDILKRSNIVESKVETAHEQEFRFVHEYKTEYVFDTTI